MAQQQTIAINLVGNSSALNSALRQSSLAWKSLDMDMKNVLTGQMLWKKELNNFTTVNGKMIGGLGSLRAMLEQVKEEKRRVAASVQALSREFNEEELEILGLTNVVRGLNTQTKNMSHAAGSAQFAVISLGQGFADAGQFGMGMAQGVRAVTNNVQQAVQAFVMLSQQTEKGQSAFGAFANAMRGPAGFLVLFSLATAAIEFFSNRMQRAKKDANMLGDSFSQLFSVMSAGEGITLSSASRLRDLQEGYRLLAENQIDVANANSRVVTSTLVGGNAAGSAAIAFNEAGRAAIIAAEEYNSFADSLEDSAKQAEANEEALAMLERTIGANERRTEDLTVSRAKLTKTLVDLQTPMSDEVKAIEEGNKALQQQIDTLKLLNEIKEGHIGATASRLKDESIELEEALAEIGSDDWLPDFDLELGEELMTPISDMADRMRDTRLGLESEMNAIGTDGWLPEINLDLGKKLTTEADLVDKAAEKLRVALSRKIGGAVGDFAVSMASADGGFDSFGDKLKASMGGLMQDLGKAMIQFAVSGIAIKKFITNPWLAFAAGTALVALGSRLSKSAQSKVDSATGGGGGAGMAAPSFVRPGVNGLTPIGVGGGLLQPAMYGGNSGARVSGKFVVQGRDLVAAVKNETEFQSSMGMGGNIVIGG